MQILKSQKKIRKEHNSIAPDDSDDGYAVDVLQKDQENKKEQNKILSILSLSQNGHETQFSQFF